MQAACQKRGSLLQCRASQKGNKDIYYRLLEVSPNSSRADIRTAYINKIRTMHPDISTDEDATSDAVALNAAYAALMVGSCTGLQHYAVPAPQHVNSRSSVCLVQKLDLISARPSNVTICISNLEGCSFLQGAMVSCSVQGR